MTAPNDVLPQATPAASPPRRGWLIALIAAVVLAIAGSASGYAFYEQQKNREPAKIKALISDFAHAVGGGDPQTIAGLMCKQEAESFLENAEDVDGAADSATPAFEIGDVTVHGDVASATLKFKDREPQTLYFRKESGKWTVCAPAKDQM